MLLTNPTGAAFPTALYTQRLSTASNELASVRTNELDTQLKVDTALSQLHRASAGIFDALTGAAALPDTLPGGVVSFPRDATDRIDSAVTELARFTQGKPFDAEAVRNSARSAIANLEHAISLIKSPPSDEVYDGS